MHIRRPANPFYASRARHASKPSQELNVLDLFSGIGGFSLGLERSGMRTAAFCEIDPFCRDVLRRHWPTTPIYDDIRNLNARRLHHDIRTPIDLICGGYPCQPFSVAGKRRGAADPRHLWPEMHRLILEIRPRWVVAENVSGHVECGLDAVLDDLDAAGYTAWTFIIPACAVGAPHRRDRVWIVAHARGLGCERTPAPSITTNIPVRTPFGHLPTPFVCGDADGIPHRMERTHALGNAVVPQIPEIIGRAILTLERSVT